MFPLRLVGVVLPLMAAKRLKLDNLKAVGTGGLAKGRENSSFIDMSRFGHSNYGDHSMPSWDAAWCPNNKLVAYHSFGMYRNMSESGGGDIAEFWFHDMKGVLPMISTCVNTGAMHVAPYKGAGVLFDLVEDRNEGVTTHAFGQAHDINFQNPWGHWELRGGYIREEEQGSKKYKVLGTWWIPEPEPAKPYSKLAEHEKPSSDLAYELNRNSEIYRLFHFIERGGAPEQNRFEQYLNVRYYLEARTALERGMSVLWDERMEEKQALEGRLESDRDAIKENEDRITELSEMLSNADEPPEDPEYLEEEKQYTEEEVLQMKERLDDFGYNEKIQKLEEKLSEIPQNATELLYFDLSQEQDTVLENISANIVVGTQRLKQLQTPETIVSAKVEKIRGLAIVVAKPSLYQPTKEKEGKALKNQVRKIMVLEKAMMDQFAGDCGSCQIPKFCLVVAEDYPVTDFGWRQVNTEDLRLFEDWPDEAVEEVLLTLCNAAKPCK